MAVIPKDENLEELPEGKPLENNGYGEILTPESDAVSAQSPNRDIHITKISETEQGIVTVLSVFVYFILGECIVRAERLIMHEIIIILKKDFHVRFDLTPTRINIF